MQSTPTSNIPERLIDTAEFRRRVPVSAITLWRWERDKVIPKARRFGQKKFWPESVVDRMVNGEKGAQ